MVIDQAGDQVQRVLRTPEATMEVHDERNRSVTLRPLELRPLVGVRPIGERDRCQESPTTVVTGRSVTFEIRLGRSTFNQREIPGGRVDTMISS